MKTVWYESEVIEIHELAPNVRRFRLRYPDLENFEFEAGQFITMDLPIGEKRLQRWRSYSLASAPSERDFLELCIVRNPKGEATRYLFEEVKIGTSIKFKGPDGAFCLPKNIETDLVFICTGTGLAPFRSMLREIERQNLPHRNIHLIFGTRHESGILYREEFEKLASHKPDFQYDIALSKSENWTWHRGYVHEIYLKKYAEKRADVKFFLCGWANMIDDAVANLLVKCGYERGQVSYELYG